MLTRTGLLLTLLLTGCGMLDPDPKLQVEFDSVALAVPPDTLQLENETDWYEYPPILSVTGSDGSVIVRGDYTMSCSNAVLTGAARVVGDQLEITVGHRIIEGQCRTTPKVGYRATVSPLSPGALSVAVSYEIWDERSFGGVPSGVVHRDTVVVR